jgi:WD40 repeat protein
VQKEFKAQQTKGARWIQLGNIKKDPIMLSNNVALIPTNNDVNSFLAVGGFSANEVRIFSVKVAPKRLS